MIGEIKSEKLHSRNIRSSLDHRTDKAERDCLQLPAPMPTAQAGTSTAG